MGQPTSIALSGALVASPVPGTCSPSLHDRIDVSFTHSYTQRISGSPSVNATQDAPFVLPFGGVAKGRALVLRVRGGSLRALITTPAGAAQAIRISDLLVIHNPAEGDQLTAVSLIGTAEIEYLLAGD